MAPAHAARAQLGGRLGVRVNLWLAGVAPGARRRGELRALLARLLRCVGWRDTLTMSTRPRRFAVMAGIMSRNAALMDEQEGDRAAGKLRFAVAAWQAWLSLYRGRIVSLLALSLSIVALSILASLVSLPRASLPL